MTTGLGTYGRVFCLISGASRGLGRGLAIRLSERLDSGSFLLLVARNSSDLEEVKKTIDEKNLKIGVEIKSVDLTNADSESFKVLIESALKQNDVTVNKFDTALVIHNVGSLGNISKNTLALEDINELRSYYDLNVFSPILLNTAFFKLFTSDSVSKQVVINISSLAAITPFKTWSYYCTGKAAREMFFKVMAAEFPQVRVLNYSPGPLKTEMTIRAREETLDDELRQWFKDAYQENRMLEVDFTIDKLFSILEADKFNSGDHVDVYDDVCGTRPARPAS